MKDATETFYIIRQFNETCSGCLDDKKNKDGENILHINRSNSGICSWFESDCITNELTDEVIEWNIQPSQGTAAFWTLEEPALESEDRQLHFIQKVDELCSWKDEE